MTDRVFRTVVAAICGYEVFAIATRRVPTVSRICRHPLAAGIVIGGLVYHFGQGGGS